MTDITELAQMKGQKVEGSYYLAECTDCGKMYPSNKLNGGEPLFCGDYGECYCPHCNADDAAIGDCGDTAATAWNYQQNRIDALVEALEKAQCANAAQDDHINQQQDRIDQLEKGHQEAAKQINSWRRMAKQNIAEREKDIAELDAARQCIAELESHKSALLKFIRDSCYVFDGTDEDISDAYVDAITSGLMPKLELVAACNPPLFWVRVKSDGGYDGPVHDSQLEEVRKKSGEWLPLTLAHIAELESRTVKLPKPHAHLIWIQAGHAPDDYWDDVAVSHSEKDRCCDGSWRYPVYARWEIEEMLAAAGIKWEAE